jgi:hypothetical protein
LHGFCFTTLHPSLVYNIESEEEDTVATRVNAIAYDDEQSLSQQTEFMQDIKVHVYPDAIVQTSKMTSKIVMLSNIVCGLMPPALAHR